MICQQLHIPVSRCERATCIKGYLAPSGTKNESCEISSNWFIRRMVQVYNSGIYFTSTVAMVTKKADKIGRK